MLSTSGGSVAAHASSSLDLLLRAMRNPAEIQLSVRPPVSRRPGGLFQRAVLSPFPETGGNPVCTMTSAKWGDVNHPRG